MVQSPSWEANWFAASQEIPHFHGTRRFITALTSVRHLSLSWASPIQSTSWRSILILSTHLSLGLPSSWKLLRKLKWQIPREPLAALYDWCHGPAVDKHCSRLLLLLLPRPFLAWPFWTRSCDWAVLIWLFITSGAAVAAWSRYVHRSSWNAALVFSGHSMWPFPE